MSEDTRSSLRDAFWHHLIEAWPYEAAAEGFYACGMCFALVAPSGRQKHAEWHVGTMPDDQWEKWCETTVDLIARSSSEDLK